MHVSQNVSGIEMVIRKLNSRFRRPPQASRSQWPVISAIRPLFYLIRFFGLAPFEISENHSFIPGSYDLIYSLFCTIIHSYVSYTVMNRFALVEGKATATRDFTESAKAIFNYFVTVFNVLAALWTRKEFIDVLNIMKHFDSRIRDLGHPQKEGTTKVWVWGTCVCSAVMWIVINRIGMVAFYESWIDNMAYILNYIATSLSTIKFSGVVLLLGQRFRHLNRIVQHSKESAKTNEKNIAVDYKVIQQLHDGLMEAGESLSSQYEWPLLLWLTNLCIHSVSNLYFLIDWLMITPDRGVTRGPFVSCITLWLVTFVAQLLLLHVACHLTSAEANSMGSITTDWKNLAVNKNFTMESSLQLLIRKLNFSAAGCFHVNLPLLCSISALLTTYLVLLLQFQN